MRRLWGFESQLPYEDWSLRLPLNSGANMKMIEAEVNPRPLADDLSRAASLDPDCVFTPMAVPVAAGRGGARSVQERGDGSAAVGGRGVRPAPEAVGSQPPGETERSRRVHSLIMSCHSARSPAMTLSETVSEFEKLS